MIQSPDAIFRSVSTDVVSFEFRSSKLEGTCTRSPMHSKKTTPIVFEHRSILCVLSLSSGHLFESYNSETDKWEILEPPPLHDESSKYYSEHTTGFSYVLMDNKFCIAVNRDKAFVYDIFEDNWEPGHRCSKFKYTGDREHGPAFDFVGNGIVVGEGNHKYLISIEIDYINTTAVAYDIFKGKVRRKQRLIDFSDEFIKDDHVMHNVTVQSFAALGQNHYCLTIIEELDLQSLVNFFYAVLCNRCKIKILGKCEASVMPLAV